uniref:T-plasminogen activator n=1 Tax=Anser cygnoides TaxID=8845 RepID=A0A8B9EG40_ANSCY
LVSTVLSYAPLLGSQSIQGAQCVFQTLTFNCHLPLLFTLHVFTAEGFSEIFFVYSVNGTTTAGAECLNWADFPDYVQQYPDRGLGDHNHCRNPEGGTTPWCFYRLASGTIGWANCDCNQGKSCLVSLPEPGLHCLKGFRPETGAVSLRLKGFHRDTRLLCGATLISSCWVVTAAHCFKRCDYHTGVKDEFERELPVERIVLHRNYWAGSNDNDIALVRMRGREGHCLYFNHHVLPVCLPDRREKSDINRQACIISGWGDTDYVVYKETLLQGVVPLLPQEDCEARYGQKFTNRMICAGNLSEDKRVDSCQGDSGGPLMCQRSNGRWIILGITSWGYGCGRKDSPGVYTKVSKYVPWIKKVTKLK